MVIACNQKKTETASKADPTFAEYLDSLREQPLPLTINCGLTENLRSTEDFSRFAKFLPKSLDRVVGKIAGQNDKFKVILYGGTGDDIYPYLFSYNNVGEKIDTLGLMLRRCGGADETQIPNSTVTINNDLTIEMIDSTKVIHYSKESNAVVDVYIVDSTKITRVIMKLDDRGHFVKQ